MRVCVCARARVCLCVCVSVCLCVCVWWLSAGPHLVEPLSYKGVGEAGCFVKEDLLDIVPFPREDQVHERLLRLCVRVRV